MDKIIAGDPETHSIDIVTENLAKLKAMFPEAFAEGTVDLDVLRQLLGDAMDGGEEKYGLSWHGKHNARQLALTPSTGTLRPCPEDSVDWDTTQNLMIEGDNLEVLKLLQKSYAGKVKLIYIDPPYNTGKDFVYSDDYRDNIQNYMSFTGQIDNDDTVGGGGKLSSNSETSGRFHTKWLNMMYPRLKLARNLLRKDGAIFCSCDETEQPRLRAVMDEIFGHENFIADMIWAAGRKNDSRLISVSHEYIVCYAHDAGYLAENSVLWRQRKKGIDDIYATYRRLCRKYGTDYTTITAALKIWYKHLANNHPSKAHKHYCHADARGIYFPADISWPGGGGPDYEVLHPQTHRPVRVPSRGWMTSDPKKLEQWIAENRVHFGPDENSVPCIKSYLNDREYQVPYSVFYTDGRAATKRLRGLMNGNYFDFPKDEKVIQEIVEMITSGDDIVVDIFAGSGTTGHATIAQNAADKGSRRYLLVQLPEPLSGSSKSQAAAAGFCEARGKPHNIAELTKERLRRAGKKIKDENPEYGGDLGFRVFKLDTSNIRAWAQKSNDDDLEGTLLASVDHIEPGRTEQDILYELLLKLGLDLCIPIETRIIAAKSVHSVGAGTLMTCLDQTIARDDVELLAIGIADWQEEITPAGETTVVFRDSAFADDVSKTNLAAILEQRGLSNVRSL